MKHIKKVSKTVIKTTLSNRVYLYSYTCSGNSEPIILKVVKVNGVYKVTDFDTGIKNDLSGKYKNLRAIEARLIDANN